MAIFSVVSGLAGNSPGLGFVGLGGYLVVARSLMIRAAAFRMPTQSETLSDGTAFSSAWVNMFDSDINRAPGHEGFPV